MGGWVKGLVAGMLIGVAMTLLVSHLADRDSGIPEQIAENLGCSNGSDGVHPSNAADAHRSPIASHHFSWFAALKAERIIGVNGCDPVGPATLYLEYGNDVDMKHVLATLDTFGAVCVVDQAIFEAKSLPGRKRLKELCDEVGGTFKVLAPPRPWIKR